MFAKRFAALLTALVCMAALPLPANAAEVDCDAVYCFTQEDFSQEEMPITGICITELPDITVGTVMLGPRVLRPGDILTAEQVAQMTFHPLRRETDAVAVVGYLPVYEDHVSETAMMSISVLGKEDKAPGAEDLELETYKNLANTGKLKAADPEGQTLTYTVTRQPRRGEVTIHPDGTFTYTPKKNKVGVDSFTYTAADPAGNVSAEATVTVTILKPEQSALYTDTLGMDCRFSAEWLKNTGIFESENVVGNSCFQPEKPVTRGEFVTMLVKTLNIGVEESVSFTGYDDEIPRWLQPYLAAAIRAGLTAGLPNGEVFGPWEPITEAEAAVMIHNALDLPNGDAEAFSEESAVPAWARNAVGAVNAGGIHLEGEGILTRGNAANLLYQTCKLAQTAPGMDVIRAQQ